MAYTTISQLNPLSSANAQNTDLLLVSSGDKSYKLKIGDLKNFMNVQFVLEDWMFENKTITSITNTIHATALHFEAVAVVDIQKGQVITMSPDTHNGPNDLHMPHVILADNRIGPALGIAKDNVAAGDRGAFMSGGIFTYQGFNTMQFNAGSILWLGQNGQFTSTKPESLLVHQACGFVMHKGTDDGAIMVAFQSIEPQGHDVTLAGFEYGLQAKDVESAIAEMFSKCNQELVTISKVQIQNNKIQLTNVVDGDIVLDSVRVFDTVLSNSFDEYTCSVGQFYNTIEFDSGDNLNGKYATLTYLAAKPWTHETPWLP